MPRRRQSGMEGEGEHVGVGAAHPGHHGTDQVAGRVQGDHGGLVLVQGLDDVAPSVGGTGGHPGQVDQSDHVVDRGDGVPVPEGERLSSRWAWAGPSLSVWDEA